MRVGDPAQSRRNADHGWRNDLIRSMTAFAAGERNTEWGTLGCEMRAVNHRFLELGVRLPDELRAAGTRPARTHRRAGRRAARST